MFACTYPHTCIRVYIFAYIDVFVYLHMCICVHVYMCVRVHVYMYVCMCIPISISMEPVSFCSVAAPAQQTNSAYVFVLARCVGE